MAEVPLAILAGGEGRRLGGAFKALLLLCGKPLLLHLLDGLAAFFTRTIVVVHEEEQKEELRSLIGDRLPIVCDRLEVRTPLAGIYTAAYEIAKGFFAVAPVDTPFLRPAAYRRMLSLVNNYDAIVPLWPNGYLEPLIAVYRAEKVLAAASTLVARRSQRVQDLLKSIRSAAVPVSTVFEDPFLETFNVNTYDDLAFAETICSRSAGVFPQRGGH